MSDDIFKTGDVDPNPPKTELDPNVVNTLTTKLTEIKNEKGEAKYNNLETALDALKESQSYIPNLKKELEEKEAKLKELESKVSTTANVEEVVQKLLNDRNQEPAKADPQQAVSIDEDKVAKIVQDAFTQRESRDVIKANTDKVFTKLNEAYGDKSKEVVAKRAVELQTTPEALGKLAAENPDLVLSLFSDVKTTTTPTPSTTDVNTSHFQSAPDTELEKPKKSLLQGATAKEQAEYMKTIKEDVYKKLGVEQ